MLHMHMLMQCPRFAQYTVGMQEVEDAKVKSKQEGDKILQAYEPVGSCVAHRLLLR